MLSGATGPAPPPRPSGWNNPAGGNGPKKVLAKLEIASRTDLVRMDLGESMSG